MSSQHSFSSALNATAFAKQVHRIFLFFAAIPMVFVLSIHSDWVPLTEAQQQDSRDRKKVLVKGLKDANGKVVDVKVEEKVTEKSVEKKGKGRKV